MELKEFNEGIKIMRDAYGEKAFPPSRQELLFKRFQHAKEGKFLEAAKYVVLYMFDQSKVMPFLDDQLRFKADDPGVTYNCKACEDRGFGHVDDLIEACSCSAGRHMNPAEVARLQHAYDQGKKRFPAPGQGAMATAFRELPYDPSYRGAVHERRTTPEIMELGDRFGQLIDQGAHIPKKEGA